MTALSYKAIGVKAAATLCLVMRHAIRQSATLLSRHPVAEISCACQPGAMLLGSLSYMPIYAPLSLRSASLHTYHTGTLRVDLLYAKMH